MLNAIGRFLSFILGLLFWAVILGLVGMMLMGSFWLDGAGVEQEGRIATKNERITFNYADWTRTLEIGLTREDGPMADVRRAMMRNHDPHAELVGVEKVRVSSAVYDRYHVGQTVKVKVQRAGLFKQWVIFPQVRLAGQSTGSIAYSLYESASPIPQFLLTLLPAALLGWLASRTSKKLWWASALCALVAIVYWATPMSDPAPQGAVAEAEGKVVALRLVEEVGSTAESSGIDALEPHYIAAVEFQAEGHDTVVAVDRVDASSVNLKEGARVRLEYQRDLPRRARLLDARRNWWWWNILSIGRYGAFFAVAGLIWLLAARLFKNLFRRRAR